MTSAKKAITWSEIKEKYPEFKNPYFTRQDMDWGREKEFVEDCFDAYETGGFTNEFNSFWYEGKKYNGMPFKVIRRLEEGADADLESLPMWLIQFENGDTLCAFPEEICTDEANGNYIWNKEE